MFLGIDIHKREAQVAVRNEDGDVIEQIGVSSAEPRKLRVEWQRFQFGTFLNGNRLEISCLQQYQSRLVSSFFIFGKFHSDQQPDSAQNRILT